jgi:hypothetical protein
MSEEEYQTMNAALDAAVELIRHYEGGPNLTPVERSDRGKALLTALKMLDDVGERMYDPDYDPMDMWVDSPNVLCFRSDAPIARL